MKITKFPQSCLLIETKGKKILIDPGTLKYKEDYFNIWNNVDIILITHKHPDHYNIEVLEKINKDITIPIHMDNPALPPDFTFIKEMFNKYEVKYVSINSINIILINKFTSIRGYFYINLTVLLHMKEYCEQIEKTFDTAIKDIPVIK